jgi:hypothetical protein
MTLPLKIQKNCICLYLPPGQAPNKPVDFRVSLHQVKTSFKGTVPQEVRGNVEIYTWKTPL